MSIRRATASLVAGGLLVAVLAVPSGSASAVAVDRTRYRNCAALNVAYPDGRSESVV